MTRSGNVLPPPAGLGAVSDQRLTPTAKPRKSTDSYDARSAAADVEEVDMTAPRLRRTRLASRILPPRRSQSTILCLLSLGWLSSASS